MICPDNPLEVSSSGAVEETVYHSTAFWYRAIIKDATAFNLDGKSKSALAVKSARAIWGKTWESMETVKSAHATMTWTPQTPIDFHHLCFTVSVGMKISSRSCMHLCSSVASVSIQKLNAASLKNEIAPSPPKKENPIRNMLEKL